MKEKDFDTVRDRLLKTRSQGSLEMSASWLRGLLIEWMEIPGNGTTAT
jgi:hypothetical protein